MLYPKFIKLSPLNGGSRAARWKITHPYAQTSTYIH